MATKADRTDELGIDRVTIHNTETGGETEIPVLAWDEESNKDYLSYEERGWKLGPLSKSMKAPAAVGAPKEA